MAFVVATTMLTEPGRADLGAALLVASLGLALAYRAVDRRSAAPLAPRDLLAQRPLRHGAAASLLNTATTSSTITLAALYLQRSRGDGPLSAALPLLPHDDGASIINIGSMAAHQAYEGGGPYGAAKAGELQITRTLRLGPSRESATLLVVGALVF